MKNLLLKTGINYCKEHKSVALFTLGAAFLSFVYVLARSLFLPMGCDEWSVMMIVGKYSLTNFLWPEGRALTWEAASHSTNLLLTKLFWQLPLDSELFRLRISSLFAFLFYVVGVISLRVSKCSLIQIILTICLLTNAWVLDYFSLSRGYAWGIAGTIWAFVALFSEWSEPKRSTVLLMAATFSFMSCLAFAPIWIGALAVVLMLKGRQRTWIPIIVSSGLVILYCLPRFILARKDFFWGSDNGLIEGTVQSILWTAIGLNTVLWAWVFAIVLAGIIVILFSKKLYNSFGIFVLVAVSTPVATHYLLGTPYPIERAAFWLWFVFVISFAVLNKWMYKISILLLLIITLLGARNLNIQKFTLRSPTDNAQMADIPTMVKDLTSTGMVVVLTSDGCKWQFWYYSELKFGVQNRFTDYGCGALITTNLFWYEAHCGAPKSEGMRWLKETTDILLSPDDPIPEGFKLSHKYPCGWSHYQK